MNRSKRIEIGATYRWRLLFEQIELIEPTILFFLSLDISPDRLLINSYGGNEISTSPKMGNDPLIVDK